MTPLRRYVSVTSKNTHKYNHLLGKHGLDPLKVDKKRISTDLIEINLEHLSFMKTNCHKEISWRSLSWNCYTKFFDLDKKPKAITSYPRQHVKYVLEEVIVQVDSACSLLRVSPAAKIRKLSLGMRKTAIE